MYSKELMVGQVFLKKNRSDRERKNFTFKLNKSGPLIKDHFTTQFDALHLNIKEEKCLTQDHLYELKFFINIEEDDFLHAMDALHKNLLAYYDERVIVEASSTGAFLCLACILSGKLPRYQDWTFELSELPLALFPVHLIKAPEFLSDFNVHFNFHPKSWMNALPCLKEAHERIADRVIWRDSWHETPELLGLLTKKVTA